MLQEVVLFRSKDFGGFGNCEKVISYERGLLVVATYDKSMLSIPCSMQFSICFRASSSTVGSEVWVDRVWLKCKELVREASWETLTESSVSV